MALSLSWASAAQAGVGDTITEFVESRSSLTTALATIAFILLLVLTSGVSLRLEWSVPHSTSLLLLLLPAVTDACHCGLIRHGVLQVIYLSVAAWGDRTDESKDRLDEERADRCALCADSADCHGCVLQGSVKSTYM